MSSAQALMESVLRDGEPLAREYPLVFEDRFAGSVVTVEEDGDVRSACAVLPRDLLFPNGRLRAGMIGSVSTDPLYRGRGLATEAISRAEAQLARSGCAVTLLWADDPAFYERRGYADIGAELVFVLEASLFEDKPAPCEVRVATVADLPRIHDLYTSHPERVDRSADETAALFESPGMEVLVRTSDGAIVGYACVGRGADLQDVLHEWAGSVDDVIALIHGHVLQRGQIEIERPLYVLSPPSAGQLNQELGELGAPLHHGVLGMAKLVDVGRALELVSALCPGVSGRSEGDDVVLCGAREVRISRSELLQLVCSAKGERHLHVRLERDLGSDLNELPVAPFVWGLDSI